MSIGRSAWWVVMLSLETGCERPSPPPVQTPPPASPPESPPPEVDPAALPVCGKDMIAEPLAAICALSRPAADVAIGCAEPERMMWCSATRPGYTKWGCSFPLQELPATVVLLQTATEGEPPPLNAIIEPKPISGSVAAAEASIAAADGAAGTARVADWRAQLERWGCVAVGEPSPEWVELQCGRFEVLLDYLDVTRRAYVKATLPGVARCWQ
ncbi:hypothetical protein [Nannocystis bainbridge]|uniref:Lipoprotein n=1 Tax=Nannocystis bainbridge TaxID=2995303 RepID=A0ABT5DX94_9BACT|nr:hypothetical protein [Nannocystis bainbridge]MDC0717808.1 hypothetical protein [Nannocystis bainbridge]